MSDIFHKLLILRTPGIGPVKYNELVARFGGVDAAAASLTQNAAVRDAVMREMERAAKLGIHYICDTDDEYPANLRMVKNHPTVLSVRGNIKTLARPTVSIVGTRHSTAAGMGFIANLAFAFAQNNYAVASGMAIGTDTAAHRGALRASGDGQTIAVVAGGVDYIWPVENESLYWDIVARGAVISEMPVGFVPKTTNFIQRNRWVAGIGEKLILGEADLKSGSMATARFALDFNREIYAIPSHPSDSRAMGPNSLIKSGVAKLCDGPSDFFDDGKKSDETKKNEIKKECENCLLDKLGAVAVSESVLADVVKKSISEIRRDLVMLELQGLVRKTDGGYVRV